ncbi:hypothetical protein [Lacipirellula parvula]|uniref:PEP-CTERM protein-sorting domain-containing protein n=1 Tax=Lacipirellula parvula TaxID=2650471 RepID=A0A5K7XIG5_9BACT|nr:hypothetical protein [Lacipirellula parvula]BBO36248.1 hypothetical protein PLANPX_5860 [Lacipirellula parvula]
MNATRSNRIWLAGTIGLLLALGSAPAARAVDKSWNAADSDSWSNAARWTPAGAPGAADVVRLGNLPGVVNHTVFLNQDATIAGLQISNGMALQNEGHVMIVAGDTTLSGDNTRLNVEDAGFGTDYFTHDLIIGAESNVWLQNGIIGVSEDLIVNGQIRGLFNDNGGVQLSGTGTTLTNNGLVAAGAGVINCIQTNDGAFDLDGQTGNGEILVSGSDVARLSFSGGAITDAFSGLITLGPYARLNMSVGTWTADASSFIDVFGQLGNQGPAERAVISGDRVTLAGGIDVGGWTATLEVAADATLAPTANVVVGEDDRLIFLGDTSVEGGTFNTNGIGEHGGQVNFNGATEWAGTITVNGRAQQNGDASVTSPTVVNAGLFDFSGEDNHTNWNIAAPFVINAVTTKTEPFDFFEGEMTISGGFLGKLTMNLGGGTQFGWSMNGVLNLSGNPVLFVNRIDGAHFVMNGQMNVDATKVEIGANVFFWPDAQLNFASAASQLRLRGESHFLSGAEINGAGTIINGLGGEMCIHHTVVFDAAGLENHGRLKFRGIEPDLAALVAVNRFVNDDDGTLQVRVGGDALGESYDHLLVTDGAATLDGLLEVLLFDASGVPFAPQIGDAFPIITALGGVAGTFDNAPVSHRDGLAYHWAVDYSPYQVSLRLEAITVPEPATMFLAITAAATLAMHRRRRKR